MSTTNFTFKTITEPTEFLFKDRGSKFLAFSYPIDDLDAMKEHLKVLKKAHPKANHHCYAFRLGTDGLSYRASDDGEPAGSAGRPILGQIDSFELTDILVVVVRYFGGTLLGVPGLINAYKEATAGALAAASIIEKNIEHKVQLEFDYSLLNEVMQVLKQFDAQIYRQEMLLFCNFSVGIPLAQKDACMENLKNLYGLEIK